VRLAGAAIECRINAEDPARDFAPSPGRVREAVWPTGPGIRVDTHVENGASVPPFYDSLMAKIIAHGPTRAEALARLRQALDDARIVGVASNIGFHRRVLADPEFAAGGVDTAFLARFAEREAAVLEG
jgi:acetyl-CoA carboxylase biotin carboxylase subunit